MSALALTLASANNDSGGVATVYLLGAIAAFIVAYFPARTLNISRGGSAVAGIVLAIIVVAAVMYFDK